MRGKNQDDMSGYLDISSMAMRAQQGYRIHD